MKVRMRVSISGPGLVYAPGDIAEVSANEAKRFVAAGIADLVRDAPVERAVASRKAETAVPAPAPETATPAPSGEEAAAASSGEEAAG